MKAILKFITASTLFVSVLCIGTEVHDHKSREVTSPLIPKVAVNLFRDEMDGVNVHIELQNYVLNAPTQENISRLKSEGGTTLGHAHLFINGVKHQRIYAQHFHISEKWLKKGVNQIAISLNSHQHENWQHNNQTIVGTVFFDLNAPQLVLHEFTSQPLENTHNHH